MGVIQRQSIKHSIISFGGVFIGAISTLFIYPKDLDTYGLLNYIISFATLLMPLVAFGVHALVIRFFPDFKDEQRQHHGFLGLLLLLASTTILLSGLLLYTIQTPTYNLLQPLGFDIADIANYAIPIFILSSLLLLNKIFTSYISVFGRIVVPNILNNLFVKLLVPALVLLYFLEMASSSTIIYILLASYGFILLSLVIYTAILGQLHWKPQFQFLTPALVKRMRTYALYGVLAGMGTTVAQQIDSIMISTLVDFKGNGGYNIFRFMSNTIDLPLIAMIAIGGPIISDKFKHNDLDGINSLYQKTSLNALIPGVLLFIGVFCNLDDLLHLTGRYADLAPLKSVFIFLGLAKLFDLLTSLNAQIIGFSKYFRFNLVVMLILALLNVVNNYLFIEIFGLNEIGAAIATCISILLYNVLRLGFIWLKFRMLPFTKETIVVLVIGLIIMAIAISLPLHLHPILNMLIRSVLIASIYAFIIVRLHISEEVNSLVMKYWKMVFK